MTGVVNRRMPALHRFDFRQHFHAQIRRKHHRHDPGSNQGDTDDPEHVAGVLTGSGLGKTVGHESDGGDQRACQHRGCRVTPGIGRGFDAVVALFHLHHHHLDGDDRIIDQQPERQDQRAQSNTVKVFAGSLHHHKHNRQRQRHRRGNHYAYTPAHTDEAHHHDHQQRDEEFDHELVDGGTDVD